MKMAFRPVAKPLAVAVALLGAPAAQALQFDLPNDIKASVDTTLSYGISVRAATRDPNLIGIANGGTTRSVNEDDGDLNFERGKPFANVIKATTDVELKWRNFGFFGRGTAYYDFDLHDSDKLGPTGRDRLGKDLVGLDGFFSASFAPAGHNLRLRAGRQVISWGESTFIPNGINVVNPVDLSKLRIPGSELKEAFIPTTGLWGSFELTRNASLEGFYLTNHDKVRLDPRGSYFSNNDFASDDANRVILSFGRRQDEHFPPGNPVPPASAPVIAGAFGPLYTNFVSSVGAPNAAASVWAPRGPDRNPSDDGQYGVALRYLAPDFNNTEFALYFMNYHSRTPFFSGIKGTPTSALTGTPLGGAICQAAAVNTALRSLCHSGTASAFAEYPEDIRLYGLSFNTGLPGGIALQGEYSYRPNQPLQVSTPELLLAALGLPNIVTGFAQIQGAPAGVTSAFLVPDGTTITGWRRQKMSQLQFTLTKSLPSVMGAEQLVLVAEPGFTWFHNLGDLKYNGPANYLPATAFGAQLSSAFAVQDPSAFVTEFSWGYRLAGRLEYANALFGGNLAPRVAFAHDVKGVSPTFNQGVKSSSIGLSWDYQRKWVVDVQYTNFFGGRTFCGTDTTAPAATSQPQSWCSSANPLKDRDFYSLVVSYSF